MPPLSRISVNGFALALGVLVYVIDAESESSASGERSELDQRYTRLYGVAGFALGLQG